MSRLSSQASLLSRRSLRNSYHQLKFAMNKRWLGVQRPLPHLTDYSIAADFANILIAELLRGRSKLIVEAGCGFSTMVAAYCLRHLGRGLLVSLEHDKAYLDRCQQLILEHGLQEYVQLVHAPLERVTVDHEEWLWYNPRFKDGLKEIDVLVVDGPPATVQPLSRYPILPILFDRLSSDALVLMDDGCRPEEREIAARWNQQYGCFDTTYVETERGLIRLKRR